MHVLIKCSLSCECSTSRNLQTKVTLGKGALLTDSKNEDEHDEEIFLDFEKDMMMMCDVQCKHKGITNKSSLLCSC